MNRSHLRWSDYDNNGDVLPDGYKRLKDGTITEMLPERTIQALSETYKNLEEKNEKTDM